MGEVGGREERRGRGGTGVGKGMVGWCGLAVAREQKRAADKELAAARFGPRCYC